jgi:hypothetical protein
VTQTAPPVSVAVAGGGPVGPASGRLPQSLLLIQRSAKDTPAVASWAARMAAGDTRLSGVGTVIRLGRESTQQVAAWMGTASSMGVRIADPEAWTRYDQLAEVHSVNGPSWAHLTMPMGQPGTPQRALWIRQTADAQVAAGASVLLSPGSFITGPAGVVAEVSDAAGIASTYPRRPLLLNLPMDKSIIIDPVARATMLARMLPLVVGNDTLDGIFVRVRVPSYSPSYTEPRRTGLLEGLADFVSTLARAGVRVILPNLGVTGWMLTGFGAAGFGAGTSWSQRAWLEPGGGPQGVGRMYEPQLLHTVPATVHQQLVGMPGFRRCRCRHCLAHWATTPPTALPLPWDFELAGLHYLEGLVNEFRALPTTGVKAHVHQRVLAADALATSIGGKGGQPLHSIRPTHLPTWDRLLS